MSELRFDGQTAIVTGAGGRFNLGRAYARLLAARGARVVVNDIDKAGAERVAKEILDAGGQAVADSHDIAQEGQAKAVVENAMDSFGRVDILVNNAGAIVFHDVDRMATRDVDAMVGSHLMGAMWLARAVWPHFRKQRYGRIVMALSTASGRERWLYYTVKAGLRGLNYSLAFSGARLGITCNGVTPLAGTDSTERHVPEGPVRQMMMAMSPDLVAPIVAVLAHKDCPVNGEEFHAIAGAVTRYRYEPPRAGDPPVDFLDIGGFKSATLTPEDVVAHWSEIVGADYRPLVFAEEFEAEDA